MSTLCALSSPSPVCSPFLFYPLTLSPHRSSFTIAIAIIYLWSYFSDSFTVAVFLRECKSTCYFIFLVLLDNKDIHLQKNICCWKLNLVLRVSCYICLGWFGNVSSAFNTLTKSKSNWSNGPSWITHSRDSPSAEGQRGPPTTSASNCCRVNHKHVMTRSSGNTHNLSCPVPCDYSMSSLHGQGPTEPRTAPFSYSGK